MKTTVTKISDIKRMWWQTDADSQILGRLATKIAGLLIGKDKVNFVPNLDCGDYVVVTNIEKIKITGRKKQQKVYHRHSGFPGGLREISYAQQMSKDPRKILFMAVKSMLPKNKLQDRRMKRLRVFAGPDHIYQDKNLQEIK